MRALLRSLLYALALLLLLALAAAWGAWRWLDQPLALERPRIELEVARGASACAVAAQAVRAGVQTHERLLCAWFRLSGQGQAIQAGHYELGAALTPRDLLDKLVRGQAVQQTLTIVEGWNWRQLRAALMQAPHLRLEAAHMEDAALMQALGRPGLAPEGRFFPDTYAYLRGSSDIDVLRQALRAMDDLLARAWEARAQGLAIQSPEEALVLASIIEKETGLARDRGTISGVFHNRLRRGMLLQTDPTVIYGLGADFDGRLLRRHLQQDTPWNTYTRAGLPPTPIAMPGRAALMAAVQPEQTQALYFVARGDGSSQFSATLDEHNRAVQRHLRGPRQSPSP